jgi:hypothetical protein
MATPDISRQLFQPEKRYIGTFMQQGRVVTDEDLNEHRRLAAENERLTFRDIICSKGSPNHGFRIGVPTPVDIGLDRSGYDFSISDGSFYIGGLRFAALAEPPETFLTQRDWLQIDVDSGILPVVPSVADLTDANGGTGDRFDLVYMRGWEQCVSAVEDREMLEYALGGPDTSVFNRRQRRVEVLADVSDDCAAAFQDLIHHLSEPLPGDTSGNPHPFDEESSELLSKARLTVGFTGEPPGDDLCQPPVLRGYLGAENQAIRVQLTATNRFIWGFDNAAPLYRVQVVEEEGLDVIRFLTLPRDEFAQPKSGQAVEILPWGALLPNHEKAAEWQGHVTTVATGFDPDTGRITIESAVPQEWINWLNDPAHNGFINDRDEPAAQRYLYLRVWTGGSGDATQPDFTFVPGTAVALGDTGLEVTFSDFGLPGSYWVIAARPNTPDEVVPWLLTENAPAFGPRQFFAGLALIRWSIDPIENTVVGSLVDCRARFRPLCQLKGCCTIVVGDGTASHGEFNSIQDAVNALPPSGGEICVLRGRYEERIRIANRSNIKIHGCGRETLIVAQNESPVIEIVDSRDIEINSFAIEAPVAPAVLCHATSQNSTVEHIVLTWLCILSRDRNSVAVFRGRSITFAFNEVIVLELAAPFPAEGTVGREPAVFLHGEDLRIEQNRIFAEGERAAQRGYGGLHIGGGSERVEVRRNLIRGGNNNGITLGHAILRHVRNPDVADHFTIGVNSPGGTRIVITPQGCVEIDPFPPQEPPDGEDGTVLEAGPALRDLRIADNRIEEMGRSGISVERFFDMETNPDFITVEDLFIEQNRITDCMRLEIGAIPFPLRDVIGFGGVALADVEYLVLRENLIANNGHSSIDPICGVFVLHGAGIAVDGNRILHNGRPAEDEDQLPRPGRRGGIVLAFARARAEEQLSIEFFGRVFSGQRQDGVPAARVHDNIVVAQQGRALEILALGPVSVEGNQLTAKGSAFIRQVPVPGTTTNRNSFSSASTAAGVQVKSRANTSNPLLAFLDALGGSAVSIFNLGFSNEIYLQLFGLSGLFLLDDLPTPEAAENVDDPRFFIGGNVLFNDNQVVLDALGPVVTLSLSSVFLGSLDDVSMIANQCDCDLAQDFVLTNALAFGWSQRMADNRFKEGLVNALLSGTSLALMNTTTDNQGTHCFFPVGTSSVSYIEGNRSLVQLNSDNRCPRNDFTRG